MLAIQSINQITEECSRCPQMRHEIQSLGGRKARQSSWRLICRRRGLLKCIHRIRQLVLGFMLWQRFFYFVGWRPCSVWRICLVILNALLQLCQWWRSWKFPVLFVCLFVFFIFVPLHTNTRVLLWTRSCEDVLGKCTVLPHADKLRICCCFFVFFPLLFIINIVFPGDVA